MPSLPCMPWMKDEQSTLNRMSEERSLHAVFLIRLN